MSGEILAKAWLPMLPTEPCKVLIVNPFPTAFVLTLRGDGVKRALDAAGYPYCRSRRHRRPGPEPFA